MSVRRPHLLLLALTLATGAVLAADAEQDETEDGKEKTSPDPVSVTPFNLLAPPPPDNAVELRYLYVDEPNGKFGEYNGLDEDKHHGVLNLDALLRDAGSPNRYWDIDVRNLGLETYHARVAYGHQGRFRLYGGVDQLQKVWHEGATTPWSDELEMLDDPREVTTRSRRRAWTAGFDALLGSNWTFTSNYRDEDRDGQRSKPVNGGRIVPQRLDMNHQQFDAALAWSSRTAQLAVSGYLSEFTNAEDLVLNTAAAPNNDYQKFSVNGGWRSQSLGRFTAYLGRARGRQDDPFSRYGIDPGTYETDSLQGEVDLTQFRLSWRHRFSRRFDMDAGYWREDRDTDTPLWSGFPSDKNNRVYDWKKQRLHVKGRFRLPGRWRLIGAVEFDDRDYTVRKVPRTTGRLPELAPRLDDQSEETTIWAELRSPVIGGLFGSLKVARGDRDVQLDPVREEAATVDTGGLALSSYLLPRTRDRVDLTLTWSASELLTFGLLWKEQSDDYDPIAWASLEQVDLRTITLDVGLNLNEQWTLGAYVGRDDYQVDQRNYGSQGDESTIWSYDIEDEGRFAGINLHGRGLAERIDLRVDYRYYDGEGRYETIDPPNVSGSFPDLTTTIHTLSVRADIQLTSAWRLDVGYLFEDYDSNRWPWRNDFGEPGDTWYDVLSYGYDSPVYQTQVVMISGRYQF